MTDAEKFQMLAQAVLDLYEKAAHKSPGHTTVTPGVPLNTVLKEELREVASGDDKYETDEHQSFLASFRKHENLADLNLLFTTTLVERKHWFRNSEYLPVLSVYDQNGRKAIMCLSVDNPELEEVFRPYMYPFVSLEEAGSLASRASEMQEAVADWLWKDHYRKAARQCRASKLKITGPVRVSPIKAWIRSPI